MTTLAQAALVLLLQSTGLLLLGLTALHLTRKRGPAVRTLVGRAALVSVALLALLLPLTGHIQPLWRVAVPQRAQEPTPLQAVTPPEGEETGASGSDAAMKAAMEEAARAGADASGPAEPTGAAVPEGAASSAPASPLPPMPTTPRLPLWEGSLRSNLLRSKEVGSLWAAVSAALLLWLAVCQRHLTRLRRTSRPVTSGQALALLAGLTSNPPRLLTHPSVHSPFLAGLRRPTIFLPAAFETQFDADALRAVFVHEIAHEARRDNFWTLAARLLTALLWPQPLLWLLVRKLEQISEDACDQAVLAQNSPPRAYADCILSLASRPPLALSQRTLNAGVAPFRSSVGRRISRILDMKGTQAMFPITVRLRVITAALTVAAAFGGACLVSSAPARQVAPVEAKRPALSRTQTVIGYGLIISRFDDERLCRAVENSPASRLGVPADVNSKIVTVNGQPVPQSGEKFRQLCRSASPLRLLLKNERTNKLSLVTFTTKGPFLVTTNAVSVDDQMQQYRTALADAAQARATEAQTQAQLVTAIQEALPQADPAVRAKALSVEGMIGWSLSANKLWVTSEEASRKLNHPQSVAKFQRFEAEASARLSAATLEEDKLFPKTAETQQQLPYIHALAAQAYEGNFTVTMKQEMGQVDAFLLRMRRSQMSL